MPAHTKSATLIISSLLLLLIIAAAPVQTRFNQTRHITGGQNCVSNITRDISPSTGTCWARTYGGIADDHAWSVQQTSDGGYVVAGETNSPNGDRFDLWILKLDSSGWVEWQKAYGGTLDDYAECIRQTSDGGYVVAGYTASFGVGSWDAWILKLNSTGSVEWQKTYGGSGDDYAWSIQQSTDGGYVVAGDTNSSGAGWADFWVLKLNSTGGVDWQKTYGGYAPDIPSSIQETSDGGYIVAGRTSSYGQFIDAWVLKLNSSGGVTWQKTYGGTGIDVAYSVRETSDGGYIVAGCTANDTWVLKLNSAGSVDWQKTYGGSDYQYARCVEQTSDGGYVVAGYTDSFGAGSMDVWILKLNSTGSVDWQKTYGGSGDDYAWSVQQTSDQGYIVAGYSDSFGAGGDDVWVLKLGVGGDVAWDASSGALTQSTGVTPSDSSATTSTTSVTAMDGIATVQDTQVTPRDTHATVETQSSSDITPPAAITDLATTNSTDTTITLAWTAPGDNGTLGTVTGYLVKYSTTGPIDASNWNSATSYNQTWAPAENGSAETQVVSGLAPGTTYWFAVEAYDEALNYGGVSNSPSGTTSNTIVTILIVGGAGGAVVVAIAVTLYLKKRPT